MGTYEEHLSPHYHPFSYKPNMAPSNNPWKARVRRLIFLASSATSIYILASYLLDRAREARLRALKEKKERDL
jgi:peroxin-3